MRLSRIGHRVSGDAYLPAVENRVMNAKRCLHCGVVFAADEKWKTLCLECFKRSKTTTTRAICVSCGDTFNARGAWQTLCATCFAARRRIDFEAVRAERDEALALLRALRRELERRPPALAMPSDQWRRLVQLCHPDRHGGSDAATAATRWLLENRPPQICEKPS